MEGQRNTLSGADYVVFALVLLISTAVGLYYGCGGNRQKTTREFLLADHKMSVFPVSLSLLASFMSAITLLGTPAEIYVYGTQYWMIWIGYCIMIPLCAHVYHPVFFRLKITSVFEYLELRFHRSLRVAGAIIFTIQMVLYMAIVLYAPSLALNAVTGFNVWVAVMSVGIVCTFYTTLGGIKAVMWTDVFQIVMMFAGLFAVLIKGSKDEGGFGNIWEHMKRGERLEFFNFDPNPTVRHTVWSLTFGGGITWLAIYGVNQAQVQRAMTLPKLRCAQKALYINLVGLTALLTITGLCGMVVYAQYRNCDPLSIDRISASDQLLPLYVMDRLAVPGLPGLFTACLFSGALSTISSGLNSLAAVTLQDLVRNICFKELSENRATNVSKALVFAFGVLMISLTFVAAQLGGVLQAALALFGILGGPVLGLYTLGMFFPQANAKGATAGLVVGLVFTLWLGVGAQVYEPSVPKPPVSTECPYLADNVTKTTSITQTHARLLETTPLYNTASPESEHKTGYLKFYEISYLWYSPLAVLVVTLIGLCVSFLSGPNRPGDIDTSLLFPILPKIFWCLPDNMKATLRCHVDYSETQNNDRDDIPVNTSLEKLGYVNPAAEKGIDVNLPQRHYVMYESYI